LIERFIPADLADLRGGFPQIAQIYAEAKQRITTVNPYDFIGFEILEEIW